MSVALIPAAWTRGNVAEPVLEAESVRVVRGGRAVLDGVSLSVGPGERLLVGGPSGAGKTTLFRVLALLEPPTAGTVRVAGTDVAALGERELARLRRESVGVVFQEFRLIPDLTARENAAVPRDHAGRRDGAWLDEVFDALDVADVADRYPASLSGGEKQRVAVARALANRPAAVLADEPTGQLDPEAGRRVLDLLGTLQERTGAALVATSHDPAVADAFERTVRIEDGRRVEP